MNSEKQNIKFCLISSMGGHFKQIKLLQEVYKDYEHFIIVGKTKRLKNLVTDFNTVYNIADLSGGKWKSRPLNFLISLVQVFRIFLKERPSFLLSVGGGIAVPAFLLAKLFNIKSIYVEAGARIQRLSKTGKVCYHLADLFFVQHPNLLKNYPRAIYKGSLYPNLLG